MRAMQDRAEHVQLPRPPSRRTRTLSVLVSPELAQAMIEHCGRLGVGMSQAVSDALHLYLARTAPS